MKAVSVNCKGLATQVCEWLSQDLFNSDLFDLDLSNLFQDPKICLH